MLKEKFKEYLMLRDEIDLPGDRDIKVCDIEYTIVRLNNGEMTIHYLTNGNSIGFPRRWVELFYGFRKWNLPQQEIEGKLEREIYLFHEIMYSLECSRVGKEFLDLIADICVLGTKEIRKWLESELSKELPGIEFSSLDKNLEL